jgi:hypothetical protein
MRRTCLIACVIACIQESSRCRVFFSCVGFCFALNEKYFFYLLRSMAHMDLDMLFLVGFLWDWCTVQKRDTLPSTMLIR